MSGEVLDLILLGAVALFAVSGFRQGFVVGVLSFVGFLGGGLVGAEFAPELHAAIDPPISDPVFALAVVLLAATAGQLLATVAGAFVRSRLRWRPARLLDALGGAGISAVAVLLVAWLVGSAVTGSPFQSLAAGVRDSRVLTTVDEVLPGEAHTWFSSFRRLVDEPGFPRVFGDLGGEPIPQVGPPDPALADSQAVRVARDEVVKITGMAPACSRRLEGSGFLYAPERVMTNAHVIAGVRDPTVSIHGERYDARVVVYDPARDAAVLYVPGLEGDPLEFVDRAEPGSGAVVAGYPHDGPLRAAPARVRNIQQARGPDIYQHHLVTREIYALRTVVEPGNSGGPLLAPDGDVYGVIFAASAEDPRTGYALTSAEVAPVAVAGRTGTVEVDTQGCD